MASSRTQTSVSGSRRAERQRDAELGVVARLGRDGARVRAAERGEDVLGRGLADRAGDADDAGARSGRAPRGRARRATHARRRARAAAAAPRARAWSRKSAPPPDGDERSPSSMRRESIWTPVTSSRPPGADEPARQSASTSSSASGITRPLTSARSASRATSRSSNGCDAAGDLLALLVALARDDDDVAGARQLDGAPRSRARRSSSTSARQAHRRRPRRRSPAGPRCAGCRR